MSDSSAGSGEGSSKDVALLCGASADGETLGVLRSRGESIEAAVLRKVREGQPIHGELVRLTAREEPLLFDVDVVHPARGQGPAQVATDAYRRGWDRLFAKSRENDAAN